MCRRFSDGSTTGFVATELQADEIRSFTGGKTRPTWVFAAIEVWSRLWTSTVVGRRSYRNTLALVRDVASRMTFTTCPLIVTDGFEFYGTVIRRVFGSAALYAQVIKTRRHDRVVRVDRRAVIGAAWRFDEALARSEDSSTVNTSFIERLNLTIRQGSAYLSRRTLSHARSTDTLDAHLELLRCYYNFVRPHGALKFGRETRTPAMQAGLATRRLTLRDIFLSLRRVILWLSDMRMFADLGVPTPAAVARSGSHDHHGKAHRPATVEEDDTLPSASASRERLLPVQDDHRRWSSSQDTRWANGRSAARVQYPEYDDRHGPPSFLRYRAMREGWLGP